MVFIVIYLDSVPVADSLIQIALPLVSFVQNTSTEEMSPLKIREEFPELWLWEQFNDIKFVKRKFGLTFYL